LADDPERRRIMGRAARRFAEKEFGREALAHQFVEQLEQAAAMAPSRP
jgi:glycosyltransferase involved in cell wall biosynthesis